MGRYAALSPQEIEQAIALYNKGLTFRQIGAKMHRSHSAIAENLPVDQFPRKRRGKSKEGYHNTLREMTIVAVHPKVVEYNPLNHPDIKGCDKCQYWLSLSGFSANDKCCHYNYLTGFSRGCPSGSKCTVKVLKGVKV